MRATRARRVCRAVVIGAVAAGVSFLSVQGNIQAQGQGGEKLHNSQSAIEKTKEKGFDGVDFSYDIFGAPPGQSTAKIAEEVTAKDKAEKPRVMAKQASLMKERYRLDCKTHSGIIMTKAKPQPIGPTVHLKEDISWQKLSQMTPEEIRQQKAFPAGFMRLPHVKHDVGGMVFPQKQIE